MIQELSSGLPNIIQIAVNNPVCNNYNLYGPQLVSTSDPICMLLPSFGSSAAGCDGTAATKAAVAVAPASGWLAASNQIKTTT